jgi:hypothetical protein
VGWELKTTRNKGRGAQQQGKLRECVGASIREIISFFHAALSRKVKMMMNDDDLVNQMPIMNPIEMPYRLQDGSGESMILLDRTYCAIMSNRSHTLCTLLLTVCSPPLQYTTYVWWFREREGRVKLTPTPRKEGQTPKK